MKNNGGFTLLEMIFALGLSMVVLAAGYGALFSFSRNDEVERTRERSTISAHDAMSRIKQDIRQSSSAAVSGAALTLSTADGVIVYRNLADGSGVERRANSMRSVFKGSTVSFAQNGRGVQVSVRSSANTHRRAIGVDLDCYVMPRNR